MVRVLSYLIHTPSNDSIEIKSDVIAGECLHDEHIKIKTYIYRKEDEARVNKISLFDYSRNWITFWWAFSGWILKHH